MLEVARVLADLLADFARTQALRHAVIESRDADEADPR
jgi:hypothetical protein